MSSNSESTNTAGLQNSSLDLNSTVELPQLSYKQTGEVLLMGSLKAPMYQPEKRAALDIVAVIDKSGSMEGVKLDLVKTMLNHMVDSLSPADKLSIVTYQDGVSTDLPLTTQNEEGKATAKSAITPISSGGCTNLGGGLAQGVKELAKRVNINDVASVLLFTDGLVNVGPNTAPLILRAAKEAANPKSVDDNKSDNNNNNTKGIALPGTVNTFGFGADHDASLLRAIAENAGGVYYYIEGASRITESFADCFGGLLSTFGQKINLAFEAGTGVQIKRIMTKYPVTTVVPNAHYSILVGDMQSEESRDIIASIEIPSLEQATDAFPLMKISLTYHNAVTGVEETKTIIATVARPETVEPGLKRDFLLDKQHNRVIAYEALEKAADAGLKSQFSEANTILTSAISRIKESISASDEFCVNLVADLEKCKEGLESKSKYASGGHQTLSHNYMAHTYQRSTNQTWSSQSAYQTTSRNATSSKWSAK